MLVVELRGTILVLPPPYTQPDPTPFLELTNVGSAGVQQGLYDMVLDPNFATNHYYYVFYTPRSPKGSTFTVHGERIATGTIDGSEVVLYQDPEFANNEHHGGALAFGNDGKLYFTTGEHFQPQKSQNLSSPRGKIHRINPDGSIPTDNPFYDGSGPNWDSVWALGTPKPLPRVLRRSVREVLRRGRRRQRGVHRGGGARRRCSRRQLWLAQQRRAMLAPLYEPDLLLSAQRRDAAIVAGFVYHGSQFPSSYEGSFFFADYAQNWIKRLTFDASGNVNGVYNFEPINGTPDGPTGDVVYMTEGPDGALYYVDLGYSDTTNTAGLSKIRRIRFINGGNQPPVAVAAANPTSGPLR